MIDEIELNNLITLKNNLTMEIYNLQKSKNPENKNTINLIIEEIHDINEEIEKVKNTDITPKENKSNIIIYIGIGIAILYMIKKGRKKR